MLERRSMIYEPRGDQRDYLCLSLLLPVVSMKLRGLATTKESESRLDVLFLLFSLR